MAESFLEEQIKRIREMSVQMSRVRALADVHEFGHSGYNRSSAEEPKTHTREHSRRHTSRRRGR